MRFLIGALGRGLKELWIGLLFVASVCGANAAPVITEIMYHPVGHPGEDTREEWLEIYNPDASVADLSGWKLDRGIRFEFPPDTALESGQFLVVASNVDTFTAAHPDFAGRIVGGWKGKLGNSADAVELVNAAGERVDLLDYATRGDWAQRSLADLDGSWRGWIWLNPSDGEGASLEKIQAMLGGSSGQNWRSSIAAGGTPGTANSVAEIDIAPVIQKVTHQPIIPSPNQTVTIRATVSDDAAGGAVKVVLHWRPDGTELFTLTEMADGDGDGRFEASVPAHSDTTVVEYYIEATDAGGLARTWPAPARTVSPQDLIDGAEPAFGNVTNALYQVDASHLPDEPWQPRHHPLYRIIMTEAERADFESLQRQSGFNGPTSEFNATFVSQDGTGIKVRQSCSIRDRGYSSRFQTPYSFHVGIPDDTPWNGKTSFQLNSQYAHSQALGALVFQLAGLPSIEVVPVQVFINGVDSAVSRPGYNVPAIKGYGRYVRAEPVNGEWIARLFPDDADGNLYRMDDHAQLGRGPQLGYGGETADGFRATYFKKTNADADDWTDVIELGKATSNGPDQGYREALEQELDVDQWVRYLACNALMENLEGGLLTGRSDDFAIYRGVKDPRFILLPHDLDTTMGIGERESGGTGSLYGSYSNLKGLQRFFTDSEMHSLYRASLVDLAQTVFTSDVLDPVIDDLFTDWLPDSVISNAKRFVRLRHDRVLSRFSVDTNSVAVAFLPELADGVIQANGGDVQLSGNHLPGVKSILVDGKFGGARVNGSFLLPEWWLLVPGFQPGFHVMNVEFYSGTSGQGELMEQQFVDLFTPGTVTMVEGGWPGGESVVRWDKSTDAWRITKNFTVPEGGTLTIDPGVSVYFDRNVRLRVASGGVLRVLGDPEARVTLTHFPEADAVDDPLLPGTQQAAPKWGGILFEDSMSAENLIRNADFLNAQPGDNQGCIGVVRSECVIEGCTFRGTHRRMVYGKNCSITVDGCIFPDMFAANENPAALGFDNVSEQLKIESPGLTQEGFRDGLPIGGYLRVYRNHFYGNKGHNDVMDVDSGFLGRSPVLDCRYNHFHGHVGDEHIDLGGDAYIASNIFENGTKDPVSSDRGYSNAISSGDRGKNTTIVVARNVFHSVDHAVNCKAGAAVIFEHNTSLAFHDDYEYTSGNFRQNVLTSAVNLFITEDIAPTRGDGAYLGFNVFHGSDSEQAGFPRLISGADLASTGRPTSKIEFFHNLIDPLLKDATIGPQHTGDIFATENGEGNINGIPSVNTNIVTKWSESSPARGAAAFGLDYGHTIPEWTYTRQLGSTPRFLIGGPGIFAYRWRIADATASDWSDPIDIGSGPGFPRDVPTVRTAMLDLSMLELESGNHVLEIIGQDFAGNWQPEAIATKIEWTTRAAVGAVLLSEVMAAGDDFIELANIGTETVDLSGWIVSERSTSDGGFVIPAGTLIEQGSPVAFAKAVTGIGL
ncbi:MAG: lamin tail domain-containing protein, partial [Verrucomicrobiae bacterium]|nr:lamin tail domain-containing protein [Verrucomicrobiae bacterium]